MAEEITTISPSTNQPILTRHGLLPEEITSLLTNSTAAFERFRTTSLKERQNLVGKAIDLLEARQDALAAELTAQMGRPIAYATKELTTAVARARYLLRVSSEALADTPGEPEEGFTRFIRKVPVGPVLIVFAWNYPYLILVNALVPALLAGNSVVLKPSPQTPTIAEHVAEIFQEAGVMTGVVSYLHCGNQATLESIVRSPPVKLICFTGSVAGGLAVQRAAVGRLVPVALELGGKDPAYVRPDVDVRWAAEEIVDGAVFNSGQSCCSIERVYVHADIHDAFVAAVRDVLKRYKLGDPQDPSTQVGPVISKRARAAIEAHIEDALAKGAKDETPANASFEHPPAAGNYVRPTLLTGVTPAMLVAQEETFGPVIPVLKVHDDDEAVHGMNDSRFGLTASIWTKDVEFGQHLAEHVDAGTVFVNRCDFPSPDLAWTGWKDSGNGGATLSRFGFEQFVRLKSFHVKAYPAA